MKKSASQLDHGILAPAFILGDVVEIATPAQTQRRLIVAESREYSCGPVSSMVDYVLVDDPGPQVRLRFLQSENAKARPLILTLYDSLPYSEGLHAVVRDATGKFVIDDDSEPENHVHDEFWRVNDMDGSHVSVVTIRFGDGRHKEATVEFWDYSRLTDVEGVETEEFIFVEMNPVDRAFEIWRGIEKACQKTAAG